MGGVGVVARKALLRIAAPVVFLAAVTVVVLIARSALHHGPVATAVASPLQKQAVARFTPPPKRAFYRIQPGDTLDGIARRFKTTAHRLLLFNPGIHADGLVPGQKLRVR